MHIIALTKTKKVEQGLSITEYLNIFFKYLGFTGVSTGNIWLLLIYTQTLKHKCFITAYKTAQYNLRKYVVNIYINLCLIPKINVHKILYLGFLFIFPLQPVLLLGMTEILR